MEARCRGDLSLGLLALQRHYVLDYRQLLITRVTWHHVEVTICSLLLLSPLRQCPAEHFTLLGALMGCLDRLLPICMTFEKSVAGVARQVLLLRVSGKPLLDFLHVNLEGLLDSSGHGFPTVHFLLSFVTLFYHFFH